MKYFSKFTLDNRVWGTFFLIFVCALLLPLSAQASDTLAGDKENAKTGISAEIAEQPLVLDAVKKNSSPAVNPVGEELEKKSRRLRFRDGPVCLCADGLTESDIQKAQAQKAQIKKTQPTERSQQNQQE